MKNGVLLLLSLLLILFTCSGCGSAAEMQPSSGSRVESVAETPVSSVSQSSETLSDSSQEETETMLKIQIGDNSFTASLANNTTVDAFKELLADGPLTLHMSDYAGMEKGADLEVTLPQNNRQMNTVAGDIILYQGRTFVIYYDTNSWSLTPIGKIQNTDADTLRKALGTGDVTVTLSLE